MQLISKRSFIGIGLMALLVALVLVGCIKPPLPPEATTPETKETEISVEETTTPEETPTEAPPEGGFIPHPILSDSRVRQAIAYCTDRDKLIEALYDYVPKQKRQELRMDTFIPNDHWAFTSTGIITYPFDPEKGKELLEEAGWKAKEDGEARVNEKGKPLVLQLHTRMADWTIKYIKVLTNDLIENCGIKVVANHTPSLFDQDGPMETREFDLVAFAWVGQADPTGQTLYAKNQIPSDENNWEGQNYMGWNNDKASEAIIAANNMLDQEKRKKEYATVQQEFTKDMVSLPLFRRAEAAATNKNLKNFKADASEFSYVTNIHEWELPGKDTVILGFTQEPEAIWPLIDDRSVTGVIWDLLSVRAATAYDFDYQAVSLKNGKLPTIENGGAINKDVKVKEGAVVWTTKATTATLKAEGMVEVWEQGEPKEKAGKEVGLWGADGQIVNWAGKPLNMKQLAVTFVFSSGLKWAEDGKPVTKEDIELANKTDCDRQSGSTSYSGCDQLEKFTVLNDTTYTLTYRPGVQPSNYSAASIGTYAGTQFTVGAYPAHRLVQYEGKEVKLADVPAKDWQKLPEVTQKPWSYGPYMLVRWDQGREMVFKANPNYYKGAPKIKNLVIKIYNGEANSTVDDLITGNVDVVGQETLGAGDVVKRVIKEGENGTIKTYPVTGATWEHLDINSWKKVKE